MQCIFNIFHCDIFMYCCNDANDRSKALINVSNYDLVLDLILILSYKCFCLY